MEQKLIYEQHTELIEWLNKLAFYRDDIKILKDRLSEVALKNTSQDVLANVEHFENQFIVQKEQNDILRHDIKQYENVIEKSIAENPIASDHRKMDDQVRLRESIVMYEKIFAEMRKELISFLSKWM